MIRISKIDEKLSIYKNNTVIILGNGKKLKDLLYLFNYYKIKIDCICDTNKNTWGTNINGLNVISQTELKQLIESDSRSFTIQYATENIDDYKIDEINKYNIKSVISNNEAHKILNLISFLSIYQSDPLNPYFIFNNKDKDKNKNKNRNNEKKNIVYDMLKNDEILPIFIAQTQKTGDNTLKVTFTQNNIPNYFTHHNPNFFDKELFMDKTIKITTAVRDPIAKNISNLYQNIGKTNNYLSTFDFIKDEENFFINGGDAQILFDKMIVNRINTRTFNTSIFMEEFKKHIIDLSQHPFDKEKGYTIIKDGNLEVFVYQLEKLNNLPKIMSDWIGQTPFDKWEIANEASGKWIADSYKQAQKEITFSQEYFDRCYNDKWIQHFYSQEDIEKFKERWRPHIR